MKTKYILEEKKKIWDSMSKNVFASQISPLKFMQDVEKYSSPVVANKKIKEDAGGKKTGGGELDRGLPRNF